MKKIFLIGWITVRELIHERVLYLLAFFPLVATFIAVLLGQMTYVEQVKLTIDFLLAATELSVVLFAIFMGTSLFHREMAQGTVAMLLSKPIHRAQFLLGKFLGQCAIQWLVVLSMGFITALVSVRFQTSTYLLPILQTTFMIGLESMLLTAVVYFFAVNAGAVLTAIASLCLFALGHLQEMLPSQGNLVTKGIVFLLKGLVPNLDVLNTKSLASYGLTCPGSVVAWATAYAFLCVIFFLGSSILIFSRKDIFT